MQIAYLIKFKKEKEKLQGFLFQRIGLIARAYATKFIQIQTQECLKTTKTIHHRNCIIWD